MSPFTVERRAELHAHFSRELISHRQGLDALLDEIGKLRFAGVQIREADLNVQFRARLEPLVTALTTAVSNYHGWVDQIEAICREKLEDQFAEVQDPSNPDELLGAIAVAVNGLNDLIAQSNSITNNFAAEKAAAIRRLKNHYANQFTIDFNTEDAANRRTKLLQQVARFDRAKEQANVKLKEQQARINRAQNGREKINERIVNLLNSSALQIDVVSEGGNDRFILKRNGRIAKHLSEGEKTAIAFAFFLTKLFEEPKLDDVIVYIDDPISSLDVSVRPSHLDAGRRAVQTDGFQRYGSSSASAD
ncbi:AAA family ATPase, partial [Roseateles toxinivorans]|uniref:AAA family ATPase n=1 Tax=Roseateles toxinivorans TaxID=270368 RepID=UPI001AAD3621